MKKDDIEQLFNRLEQQFDTEQPSQNHQVKFLEKLQSIPNDEAKLQDPVVLKINWVKPFFIAASLLLLFGVIFTSKASDTSIDLADVSPEMEQTQVFFKQAIARELFIIKKEVTPETQVIVNNALEQMEHLETQYLGLKEDLKESGQDKRVIYAMIDNFQNRINLLEEVLEYIEAIKNLHNLRPQDI